MVHLSISLAATRVREEPIHDLRGFRFPHWLPRRPACRMRRAERMRSQVKSPLPLTVFPAECAESLGADFCPRAGGSALRTHSFDFPPLHIPCQNRMVRQPRSAEVSFVAAPVAALLRPVFDEGVWAKVSCGASARWLSQSARPFTDTGASSDCRQIRQGLAKDGKLAPRDALKALLSHCREP